MFFCDIRVWQLVLDLCYSDNSNVQTHLRILSSCLLTCCLSCRLSSARRRYRSSRSSRLRRDTACLSRASRGSTSKTGRKQVQTQPFPPTPGRSTSSPKSCPITRSYLIIRQFCRNISHRRSPAVLKRSDENLLKSHQISFK